MLTPAFYLSRSGWTEAMQLMVEGDKWELYIPSDLAYGDSGRPSKIGGGDCLIFTIEILKIKGREKDSASADGLSIAESVSPGSSMNWSLAGPALVAVLVVFITIFITSRAESVPDMATGPEPTLDVSEASRAALATSIALVKQWGEHWAVRELVANNDGRGFGMSFKPRRVGDRIWLEVHNLRAGSIAAEAGMELGDVLLGIGGAGDFPVTEEGAFQLLRKMPKRPDIVLVIGRRNDFAKRPIETQIR